MPIWGTASGGRGKGRGSGVEGFDTNKGDGSRIDVNRGQDNVEGKMWNGITCLGKIGGL